MATGPLNGPASATARSYSNPITSHGHTRAASSGGSFGRAEAEARLTEFDKYAEDEDEDYDDLFGKANGTGEPFSGELPRIHIDEVIVAGHQSQKLQLTTRLSNKSWVRNILWIQDIVWLKSNQLGDEDAGEEDPFAAVRNFPSSNAQYWIETFSDRWGLRWGWLRNKSTARQTCSIV
jgi:hypothetical protein